MGTKVNVSELQRRVKCLEHEKALLEEVLPPSALREGETVVQAARRIVREWRGYRASSEISEEQLRLCRGDLLQARKELAELQRGLEFLRSTYRGACDEIYKLRKKVADYEEREEVALKLEAAEAQHLGTLTLPNGYVLARVPHEAIGAFNAEHHRANEFEKRCAQLEKQHAESVVHALQVGEQVKNLLAARRWDQECIRRLEERASRLEVERDAAKRLPEMGCEAAVPASEEPTRSRPEATHSFVVSSTDDPLLAKVVFVVEVEPVPLAQVARLVADLQLGAEATEAAAQKRARVP